MIRHHAKGAYRANENSVLCLPRVTQPARRGVVFAQGAAGNAFSELQPQYIDQPRAFTDAGYPFLTADLCGAAYAGQNFGNDDHIAAIGAAVTFLQASTDTPVKNDKVFLLAGSMGTIGALNWCRQNTAKVGAVILLLPLLDLDALYQSNNGGFRAAIGTAYGVAYPTALPGLATHAPVNYPADLAGIPIKCWCSDNDPIAATTAAARTWAAAVGPTVEVVSMGAQGHAVAGLAASELVAYMDRNGGRA